MPNSQTKHLATAPFLGKQVEIWSNPSQWSEFKFSGGKFWINKYLVDEHKLNQVYEKFCEKELAKIITSQINNLLYKSIWVNLPYTRGDENFSKKTKISVAQYLKLISFSPKIDFKIGKYEKEWGINEINSKQKKFTLYFNLNLIKYDNGTHIRYVVAHELAHVFHRDHGPEFNKTLENLFPQKQNSEDFFENRIRSVFAGVTENYTYFYLFFGIFVILLLFNWLTKFLPNLQFINFFQGNSTSSSNF